MQILAETITVPKNIKIDSDRALIDSGLPVSNVITIYSLTVNSIDFLCLSKAPFAYVYTPSLKESRTDDLHYFTYVDNAYDVDKAERELQNYVIPNINSIYRHTILTNQRIQEIIEDAANSRSR